ncbi:MAG: hypothetical protein ACKO13_10075, partial [Cytophagales bacterium]
MIEQGKCVFKSKKIPDKAVIKRTPLVATGKIVDVYSDLDDFEAEKLVRFTEQAYQKINKTFKFQYNHQLLGDRIQIYCSDAVKVSHVHGGYLQAKEPLGRIFLNPRSAFGSVQGVNSTYIHELTHLFTWNFCSHTLREGLADFVASSLYQGSAIGPVPADFALPNEEFARYSKYWATTKTPPKKLKTDIDFRRGYYFSSRVFVAHLIQTYGLNAFM